MQLKQLARIAVPIAACAALMVACLAAQGVAAPKIKSTSVSLAPAVVTIAEGDVVSLTAKMKPANSTDSLTWSTSDKAVATVTKTGVVTAKAQGSCTITVKTSSRKTATCSVTVKDYLTQEEVEQLIKDGMLSEERVLELIKANTLSEADVKKLIESSTLSEADVRRIAASYAGSSGISASEAEAIAKRVTGQTWADGVELTLYNPEMLSGDVIYNGSVDPSPEGFSAAFTKVTVKKYRCTDTVGYNRQLFKYVIHAEGTYTGDAFPTTCDFDLLFMRSDGSTGADQRWYRMHTAENYGGNVTSTFSAQDGSFTFDVEQYNIFADYDMFQVLHME